MEGYFLCFSLSLTFIKMSFGNLRNPVCTTTTMLPVSVLSSSWHYSDDNFLYYLSTLLLDVFYEDLLFLLSYIWYIFIFLPVFDIVFFFWAFPGTVMRNWEELLNRGIPLSFTFFWAPLNCMDRSGQGWNAYLGFMLIEVIDEMLKVSKMGLTIIHMKADDAMVILWHKFIETFCLKIF